MNPRRLQQRPHLVAAATKLGVPPAPDHRLPAGGPHQTQQHPQRGGLTRPVRAQEAGDHAGPDLEAELIDRGDHAEPFGELTHLDHCHVLTPGGGTLPRDSSRPPFHWPFPVLSAPVRRPRRRSSENAANPPTANRTRTTQTTAIAACPPLPPPISSS